MVVVDEAHHLLSSPVLYEFVQQLSRSCPSLLLLSAIPASRREDEFLRLLALLEPQRYTPAVVNDTGRFQELYGDQRDIGRKLRLLRRRLDGIPSGEFTAEEAAEHARDLPSLPALAHDVALRAMVAALEPRASSFCPDLQAVLHYVGDTYRINRRILRNRRERLIEEQQLTRIERRPALHTYEPDQLEHEVVQAAQTLLLSAKDRALPEDLLLPFARVLFHSLVHPDAAHDLLSELAQAKAFQPNDKGRDFIALGHLTAYGDWDQYCRLLCGAVRRHLPQERIADALAAARRWWQDESAFTRWNELATFLAGAARSKKGSPPKLLLFAGFPGVAVDLAERLRARFGPEAVAEFRSELGREEKEANVRRFRSNRATWLMVSDETGGEGRNFQFAAELIHFDNPWYASRVEQRIGRLDRLGREREQQTDVVSHVFLNEWAPEAGLVRCYADGLRVYHQSVSGLEFALREVERDLVRLAIDEGAEGLAGYAPHVHQVAEEERARDDSDAVLDEASFEREAAERYRRISQSEEREKDVEEAMTVYVKMVASDRSAKARSEEDYPEGIWTLRADAFPSGWLPESLGNGVNEWRGTFRRRIAQERPDLHFFNVGHPLFDALVQSLTQQTSGRTYAIDIKVHGRAPWMGFEFVFFPVPDLAALGNNLGLVNQARQLFEVTPLHLFCRYLEPGLEADGSALRALRESLDRKDKDRTWWNLTKMKAVQLQEQLLAQDWQQKVRAAYDLARAEAVRHFAAQFAGDLGAEQARLEEIERQVRREGGTEELGPIAALRQALQNWKVELDSAGFLSVNGNILGKR
jgi:ATP-dependent helicase HepA